MNKKLLALAVAAAVSAPAVALADDSTVTLYGTLNMDFENVKADGAAGTGANLPSRNRVSQNSSNIGFRGTEPLGGGLNAIFQLEQGVNIDTGATSASAGSFATRNSNVGLSGGFGTIFFGNWDTPYKSSTLPIDAFYATGIAYYADVLSGDSTPTTSNGANGFTGPDRRGFDRRQNNSVQYWTPNLSGFQGRIAYSANEQKANATATTPSVDPKLWSLAGTYANGPLLLTATYEKHDEYANTGNSVIGTKTTSDKGSKLGAQYEFPTGTTVGVIYEQLKYTGNIGATGLPKNLTGPGGLTAAQVAGANEAKLEAYYVSVRQAFGPSTIRADFGADRGLKVDGTKISNSKAATFAIGYSYSFSKRTDFYALYTRLKNDDNSRNDFAVNGIGGVANGADPQGFGVGLRHAF